MYVLKYCCFRGLLCIRAYVFEPSRPLACNMMLVWLILFLELCCDIFPWVLDLDRTHLRVWLVYDWIGGVTSWYQSRLPVGSPLSNSLAEVESSHYKTFTNMVVCVTGPRRHLGGIRIFYSSSILWDSNLSSIRVKHFTDSDIRFSYPLPPGEPRHYRWSLASPEDSADTPRCFSRPCAHCLAVPDHR